MADVLDFHGAFIDGLRETYDAERQLATVMPTLAASAASAVLRSVLESHLEETREHLTRLEQVFWLLDEPARGTHCKGMASILDASMSVLADDLDDDAFDMHVMSSVQRAEQYEKAAYTTLVAWADRMRHADVAGLLQLTLDEETRADEALSTLVEARYMRVATPRRASRD
jgi:ferritin-like metal-binding protein YciE